MGLGSPRAAPALALAADPANVPELMERAWEGGCLRGGGWWAHLPSVGPDKAIIIIKNNNNNNNNNGNINNGGDTVSVGCVPLPPPSSAREEEEEEEGAATKPCSLGSPKALVWSRRVPLLGDLEGLWGSPGVPALAGMGGGRSPVPVRELGTGTAPLLMQHPHLGCLKQLERLGGEGRWRELDFYFK